MPGFHAGRLEGPGAARNGAQTDEDGDFTAMINGDLLRFISIGVFGIYWDLSVVGLFHGDFLFSVDLLSFSADLL